MAKETAIVSVQIPAETRLLLGRRAQENYRSVSAEIRAALDEHLSRAAPPAQAVEPRP